MMEWAAAV